MRARELLAVLASALAIALVATWPLAADMTGSLPNDARFAPLAGSDVNIWVWNFWWAQEVVTNGLPPFYCDEIFPPAGHSLAFHTHTFLWGLFALPFQWIGGVLFAYNAMILVLLAVSATAAYALARELELRPLASAVVGVAWGLSPYFMQKGLVHLNLFASPWLPLALLLLLRLLNHRQGMSAAKNALGLGIVTGLCLLTGSLQTVYLGLAGCVLILVRPRRGEANEPNRMNLLRPVPIALALLAFGITALPFLSEWTDEWFASGGYGAFPQEFHPQLSDFFTPSGLHPSFAGLGGGQALPDAPFTGNRSEHAGLYLRFSLLLLAAFGYVRVPAARRWAVGFLLLFVATWDPGPEPQGWLASAYRSLPVLDLLRVPARFMPCAILFLSVAAGFGVQALTADRKGRSICALLLACLLFESWTGSYPMEKVEVPLAVERIGDGPSAGVVLSLPYIPGANEAMLWQTQHEHAVSASYVARLNPAQLEVVRRSTPDLFALSLGLALPHPAALAIDLRHASIDHILFRPTAGSDPTPLYEILDDMDGWERSEALGDGVEWWYRTTP